VNVGLDFDLNHPAPQDPNTSFLLDPALEDLICSPGFMQEVEAVMALVAGQQQPAVGPALNTASPNSESTLLDWVDQEHGQAQMQSSDQHANPPELYGQLNEFVPTMRQQVEVGRRPIGTHTSAISSPGEFLASTTQSPDVSNAVGSSKALYRNVGLEQDDQGCVASSFPCLLGTWSPLKEVEC
jgi:hypothetical protein